MRPPTQRQRDLAKSATTKRHANRKLTGEEIAAESKVKEWQRLQALRGELEQVPREWWAEWSGRPNKVLAEQAARYDLPLSGHFVSVPKLAWAFHELLAANKHKLNRDDAPKAQRTIDEAIAQEKLQELQDKRQQRRRELLPRDEVRQLLTEAATVLREAANVLQQQYGPDASHLLNEAIDRALERVAELEGADDAVD